MSGAPEERPRDVPREDPTRGARDHRDFYFRESVAGMFRSTPDGRILDCNPALAEIFGYGSPEQLLEEAEAEDFYDTPEERERFLRKLRREGTLRNYEQRQQRRDGETIWLLESVTLTEDPSTGEPTLVGTMIDITERKKLEAELERRAHHDPLTGLPNRRLLQHRGEQALDLARRQGHAVGLLFLDLNRFKLINDSFGHAAGDRVLVEVGKRIDASIRAADTAARLGGDEFVVLLSEVDGRKGALAAGRRLRRIFEDPFRIEGTGVHLDADFGLALFPEHAADMEELLRKADQAIVGGDVDDGDIAVSRPGSEHRGRIELTLVEALREGIEKDEFRLHYQPVYRLDDEGLVGAEALLRWRPPGSELRTAGRFIAAAERSGLVTRLDRWALRTAVRHLREWPGEHEPDWIAVNLAAQTFFGADLSEFVASLLEDAGCDPGRLVLEITERSSMRDPERTVEILSGLRDLGVRIAIDDFGTGYSALAHLKRYPADLLKIDMIFIQERHMDADRPGLAEAIVELGHAIGTEVVGEGVETGDQLGALRASGCDYGQGFHLGRPGRPEELGRA